MRGEPDGGGSALRSLYSSAEERYQPGKQMIKLVLSGRKTHCEEIQARECESDEYSESQTEERDPSLPQ